MDCDEKARRALAFYKEHFMGKYPHWGPLRLEYEVRRAAMIHAESKDRKSQSIPNHACVLTGGSGVDQIPSRPRQGGGVCRGEEA
jgi:hypothetical protein